MWSEKLVFVLVIASLALSLVNCQNPPQEEPSFYNNGPWLEAPHWANEDQFPSHITIKSVSPTDGRRLICAGSLITLQWVLTSASCVIRGQLFLIRVGSVTHYTDGDFLTSFDAHIHPFYNPDNNTNDAALIRLPRALQGNNNTIITLANSAFNRVNITNSLGIVTGYGQDFSGELSPVLTYAHVQVQASNSDACRAHTRLPSRQNADQFRCANVFVVQRTRGRCFGDRGSPLVLFLERRWILYGISVHGSHAYECDGSTNLYTDVHSLRQWITNITSLAIP